MCLFTSLIYYNIIYIHLYNSDFKKSTAILGYAVCLSFAVTVYLVILGIPSMTDSFYENGLPKVFLFIIDINI